MSGGPPRLAVVVLTCDRKRELLHTLARMTALPEAPPVCVVDNGSRDGTARAVGRHFPGVDLLRLEMNIGAAGRNYGVRRVCAGYVAFCDDDTWWAPGALARAADILDAWPQLAAVTARILIGRAEREDAVSAYMGASPLPNGLGLPGAEVVGFLAGACVMRRSAFLAAGGYEPRYFIGGEETLLAYDLLAAGWHLAYIPELVVHHYPSSRRDAAARRRHLLRNALWSAWLRRRPVPAWRETGRLMRHALREPQLLRAVLAALQGLPWVLANRNPLPAEVESRLRLLEKA